MPVDLEQVGKAVDAFEEDNFVLAKDLLSKEISQARNAYLSKKLGLQRSTGKPERNPKAK